MQTYKVKTFIGVFTLDKNKKILSFKPFPRDVNKIVDELIKEEPVNKEFENFVKQNLRKYAIDYKVVKNQIEFNQLLTEVNSELTKRKIREATNKDSLIVHINNAIEEFDKSTNIFIERLREFYSLHFPEMDKAINNHKKFAELIKKYGNKNQINDPELKQLAKNSVGIEFTEKDVEIAKLLSENVIKLYELREKLSEYLDTLLEQIVPNFSALAGNVVAAKLIAKAGGIEKLAKMPSSTIQLLGSEKALFRFLKSKKKIKGPKYGIIYNHPLIQNSPKDKRGKIARLLASKLSIAIRIDYYSKEYKADELKRELEEKLKQILSADDK